MSSVFTVEFELRSSSLQSVGKRRLKSVEECAVWLLWQQRGPQRRLSSRPAPLVLAALSDPSSNTQILSLTRMVGKSDENAAFKVKLLPFEF